MLTRAKVFSLIIAALLVLTLAPGTLTTAALPEPLNTLSNTEATEAHFSDFSAPSAPSVVQATTADARNVEFVGHIGGTTDAVAVQGNYAYIGEGPRLTILDISNPATPAVAGKMDPLPDIVRGVAVAGGYAYIAAGDAGLRVVDVSTPANPTEVGFCDTPGYARGVAVAGGYAYVADGSSGGLRVVDVSNPANPTEVGFYDTPGYAWGVAVVGGTAYIADEGLRVVDISTPANPKEVGFYDTPGGALGVAVAGGYAYVADGDEGLRVVDVSTPANPKEVGFYDTPGFALGVAVAGGYVYVVDGDGLRVVDVSTPTNPTEVGFYDTPGYANAVAVQGGYAYVADRNGGLLILRYTRAAVTAPAPSPSLAPTSTRTPTPMASLVSPWPMYRHDAQRTGWSPYNGPSKPDLKWKFEAEAFLSGPVIATDGTIYFVSGGGLLHALSPAGEERWVVNIGNRVTGHLLLDEDGSIYVPTETGLYAFTSNGTMKWFLPLEKRPRELAGMVEDIIIVVGDEQIYGVNLDGTVESVCTTEMWFPAFAVDRDGTIIAGTEFTGLERIDPITCLRQRILDCTIGGGCMGPWPWIGIGPDGVIYIYVNPLSATGKPLGVPYLRVLATDGSEKWTYPESPFFGFQPLEKEGEDALNQLPAFDRNGSAYAGLGVTIEGRKRIGVINPDGTLGWSHDVDSEVWDIVLGADVVYAITRSGWAYAIDANGHLKWKFDVGEQGGLAIGAGTLYVSSVNKLYAIGESE